MGFAVAMPAEPAWAQSGGLLEALFGPLRRASQQLHTPTQPSHLSDPMNQRRPAGQGGGQAYCVRTCDGRYFPLQRHATMTPTQLCQSFCPSSRTMVFHGGAIERTVSGNTRYTDLPNAFVYRERLVEDCTCNGSDPVGLAQVDLDADTTLRPGDIVATNGGLVTFRGRDRERNALFTRIDPSAGAWAQRLAETEVVPAAPAAAVPEPPQPVADLTPEVLRDRHAARHSLQAAR